MEGNTASKASAATFVPIFEFKQKILMQITTYTLMQNKYHVMAAASSPKIGNLELHTLSSSPIYSW